ncbi:MAG: penicillin-binding transpeptidase domain-containing protein [bacterium]
MGLLNNKRRRVEIDPDEIFLDSKNLPNFNTQQFEGRLERAIPKRSVALLGSFFFVFIFIFMGQLLKLQVVEGDYYAKKSESNRLIKEPIVAPRGLIYDRNDIQLAWNTWDTTDVNQTLPPKRSYYDTPGFGLLLGYVSSPSKDNLGNYWQDTFVGKDGVEKYYNDTLTGTNGNRITEVDASGAVQSQNTVSMPKAGADVKLSIDARIEKKMYQSITDMAKNASFSGGAGVLMDINSGEVLALTSYPEYNSTILSDGKDKKIINGYFSDKRKVFLNRAVSGLYSPGSTVKPFIGYAALVENVISPFKQIFAHVSISIPNPYFPEKKSTFKDHGTFGYIDIKSAIALSSDVFFYEIGGGYQDQKGLGIANIDKYSRMFGLPDKTGIDLGGEKSGVIPTPDWKAKTFKGEIWRVGDTYNTAIGQYGFQVTPVAMARSVASIANGGTLVTPHVTLSNTTAESNKTTLGLDADNLKIIQSAMRQAVTSGTATALNLPSVAVAAKSGTAQIGLGNTNTNSWIIGFFPYDKPKYAFAVLMEKGPKAASGNATKVMSEVVDYMSVYTPEYLK